MNNSESLVILFSTNTFGDHTYESGWVLNPVYYNHGYASEAAHALLNYGFTKMKLHRIIATCQLENVASYRVMESIGMRQEGFLKNAYHTKMIGGMNTITLFYRKNGTI